jgi:hypothetical protein
MHMQVVVSPSTSAALSAAYHRLYKPVQELLVERLTPLPLRLPLLLYLIPWLESSYCPARRSDLQQLLQLLGSEAGPGAPAVAAMVGYAGSGSNVGLSGKAAGAWQGKEPSDLQPGQVSEIRLALARALARQHILESTAG